jgi:hypothetical protein
LVASSTFAQPTLHHAPSHVHDAATPQQVSNIVNKHVSDDLHAGYTQQSSTNVTTGLHSSAPPHSSAAPAVEAIVPLQRQEHALAASQPSAMYTRPRPHNVLPDGKPACTKCIPGSGKAAGHGGPHKKHISAKAAKEHWKRKQASNQLVIAAPSPHFMCVTIAPSPRASAALDEALQLLPGTFTTRKAAADAMRHFAMATGMNINQAPGQNSKWIAWRCNNHDQCQCQFYVTMQRPMRGGALQSHWVLAHSKCTWMHAVTCYSAPTPRALDAANDTAVREHIAAFKTLGAAKENVASIKRFLEARGIQIPRQSGSQDRKSAQDQQRRFCLRVCERVLGYDDEGLSLSLCKLFPWCQSFRDGGTGDSHLEIRDGKFVAVVITWHTSTAIVAECGFRVVAMDAATFEYMRKDLRLFIIVGYTSNNTLMPLAMMIAFNEDLPGCCLLIDRLHGLNSLFFNYSISMHA